jgi:alpha-L-fucosidase
MPDLETAEKLHKGRSRDWRKMLEHGDPDGKLWSPGMVDTVLRNHHWFWYANTEHKIEPLDRLVRFYYQSVGRNCNLVLGLTPDPSGLLPEPDFTRCAELGAEIRRRFTQAIAETTGTGKQLILELPRPRKIDHVAIMEDITGGERVRSYSVQGRLPGGTWRELCEGISIGHKRIQQFTPIEVAAVKLTVADSVTTPLIRNLAVYHVG